MNLVGKIFTVLVFVMCLVFMSFAVMIYALDKNWKLVVDNTSVTPDHPEGLSQQLKKARDLNAQLTEDNDRVNRDLATVKAEDRQVRAKLETRRDELETENKKNREELVRLEQQCRDAVATMKVTQTTLAGLREEVLARREEIKKANTERDAAFKEVVRLTDELHSAVNERTALSERLTQLSADLAQDKEALRYAGLNPKSNYKAKTPPAGLNGIVLAVPEQNLVEISIGADDGLLKGHKMEVVRMGGGASVYVGRIEVMRTTPDRAVCRVIPDMLKSPIQRGDRVYDKLD